MNTQIAQELENRLLRYVKIDTQSSEIATSIPSTAKQFDLLRLLRKELIEMGATGVDLKDYGALFATVPGNSKKELPTIGFLAHVDTAPAFCGTNVRPVVHRNFDGNDISFPDMPSLVLSTEENSYLKQKIGDDIVTGSGTTLLGADDKAGVAIALTVANYLINASKIKHGPIRLAFSCDEEIGRGITKKFAEDFAVDFAYTLDGGEIGRLETETFSADQAIIEVEGVSAHPGFAKDKMVNAIQTAAKIISLLPEIVMSPQSTSGEEGFVHVQEIQGDAAKLTLLVLIRDFESAGLRDKGEFLMSICKTVTLSDPRVSINCTINKQYRNMRFELEKEPTAVSLAFAAYRSCGIEPEIGSIRGGTDGSKLTELGIRSPNIFTGMQNIHGPTEWISIQDMLKATEVCLKIAQEDAI